MAEADRPLRVALVAAECSPFAKTGGLADVVPALARELHRAGHRVRVFLPRYGKLRSGEEHVRPVDDLQGFELEFPATTVRWGVQTVPLPDSARADGALLDVELIDAPALYHRDEYYTNDADEPLRWIAFCRAVLELCQRTSWAPDVLHCNDWHTGLLPLLLRIPYAWDELFAGTRTLLSIHNLGYQGVFAEESVDAIGLAPLRDRLHQEHLAEGRVSFLETGILWAHWLSTVSETYAREIQGGELGMGLDALLRQRDDHLVGILNGVDPSEWDPRGDARIPARFGPGDLDGKLRCKQALCERMGLPFSARAPVFGVVSRMAGQKGFDLLLEAMPHVLSRTDAQLVVLGSGEEQYERGFRELAERFPGQVAVHVGYDDELAHWIEAGADLFLMPSRYEPCGLNQMYSQLYGTIPVVRSTGGLADTVAPWHAETRTGTGFTFHEYSSGALFQAIARALEVWRDREAWAILVETAMTRDFSWERRARRYLDLYHQMLAE